MGAERQVGRSRFWVGCAFTAALVSVLCLIGCRSTPRVPPPTGSGTDPAPSDRLPAAVRSATGGDPRAYASPGSCAACHPDQDRAHGDTPHRRAFRRASVAHDGAVFRGEQVVTDPENGGRYRAVVRANALAVEGRSGNDRSLVRVDYALGAGVHGISYLGMGADGNWMMPRIQWYRSETGTRWDWTPGLQPGRPVPEPMGAVLPAAAVGDCFDCHSTTLVHTGPSLDLPHSRIGIECERCHGPGRQHVEWARRKRPNERSAKAVLPAIAKPGPQETISLCETCHRPLTTAPAGELPVDLARLQPVALRKSACFQKSGGILSCTTCHDPHARLMTPPERYDTVCQSCHATARHQAKLCSARRTSECVHCHMGREQLDIFGNTVYTNHWIRARPWNVYQNSAGRESGS